MSQQPNPFFGEQTQITSKRSSRVNRTNDLDFLIKQKYQEKSRERSINDTLRRSNEAGGKPEEDADYWRYEPNAKPQDAHSIKRAEAEVEAETGRTAEKTDGSELGDGLAKDHARASRVVMDSLADLKVRLKQMREGRSRREDEDEDLKNQLRDHELRKQELEDRDSLLR